MRKVVCLGVAVLPLFVMLWVGDSKMMSQEADNLLDQAEAEYERGRYDSAGVMAGEVLAAHSTNIRARLIAAASAVRYANFTAAQEHLDVAARCKTHPFGKQLIWCAQGLEIQHRYLDAEEWYLRATESEGTRQSAEQQLVRLYRVSGRNILAVPYIRRAIQPN